MFPGDIRCHFGRLHELSNNCVIEKILPKSSGNPSDQLPIIGTICPDSQSSSDVDEEIIMEGPKSVVKYPSFPFIMCPNNKPFLTYSAVVQSSLL